MNVNAVGAGRGSDVEGVGGQGSRGDGHVGHADGVRGELQRVHKEIVVQGGADGGADGGRGGKHHGVGASWCGAEVGASRKIGGEVRIPAHHAGPTAVGITRPEHIAGGKGRQVQLHQCV